MRIYPYRVSSEFCVLRAFAVFFLLVRASLLVFVVGLYYLAVWVLFLIVNVGFLGLV